ncbi:hypothetical protein [Ornithinibacillus halophilus]|uniref:Uncharacterized protein n=1 Tax=Ornithinibacillus halophilus TaxID=930117 RepID=A0A1M5E771_9BACI|nr:hypothetical protein [Ornithinibacillus halophilus]SHF75040.1 hypothetical protein SAMN05216225_10042 [Ornithinibacillus halophilus]
MAKVILLDKQKVGRVDGLVVESASDVRDGCFYVGDEALEGHDVVAPAMSVLEGRLQKVYFDLESYLFFQQAKAVILDSSVPRGVFRFRRMTTDTTTAVIAEDLMVVSSVLGKPERVWVKRSEVNDVPRHVIVTVDFGGGTMAHLDYTFGEREFIELQWSGNKKIIEFNSDDVNPISPQQSSVLKYQPELILKNSRDVTDDLVEQLKAYHEQVFGGESK